MTKVPVAENAKSKSYYKYYEMSMTQLSEEQKKLVSEGEKDPKDALSPLQSNALLDGTDLPIEKGFSLMPDGTAIVANSIEMPEVTGDMLYWWFAWHGLEALRYAIWDNEDHFDVHVETDEMRKRILSDSVPMEEKLYDVTHFVTEAMGGPASKIKIEFHNPKDLGYDMGKVGMDACQFLIAATGFITAGEVTIPSLMTHMARKSKTGKGVEFRSRFWIGWYYQDAQPVKLLPDSVRIPKEVAMGLFGHSIKEYRHLAKILPDVYKEEKGRW